MAYVVLDEDAVRRHIEVSAEDARAWYEQNIDHFVTAEQRRASHILVAVGANADEAEREKDLGVVGDKVTADSAATAEKVAAEPPVKELDEEEAPEPEAEESEEDENKPTTVLPSLSEMTEEQQIAAKRHAALRDEYTDEEP